MVFDMLSFFKGFFYLHMHMFLDVCAWISSGETPQSESQNDLHVYYISWISQHIAINYLVGHGMDYFFVVFKVQIINQCLTSPRNRCTGCPKGHVPLWRFMTPNPGAEKPIWREIGRAIVWWLPRVSIRGPLAHHPHESAGQATVCRCPASVFLHIRCSRDDAIAPDAFSH